MTNDTLLESVAGAAQMAERHIPDCCCAEHCHARRYAYGPVAPGWEPKLARLASSVGYTFHRDHLPEIASGPACSGFTTGSLRTLPFAARMEARNLGITEYSIHYKPEASKAEEFSVAVHELAHAVLGHPDDPQIGHDLFDHEMPVRLASVAVCKAAGLKTGRMAVCQMSQRMAKHRRTISLEHQNAGLIAARVITEALSPAQMRRAA